MSKYPFQLMALVLAMGIGVVLGSFFITKTYDSNIKALNKKHKQELAEKIQEAEERVKQREEKIAELDSLLAKDSVKIEILAKQVILKNKQIEKQRAEARKLTANEKVTWLINRYDSIPD